MDLEDADGARGYGESDPLREVEASAQDRLYNRRVDLRRHAVVDRGEFHRSGGKQEREIRADQCSGDFRELGQALERLESFLVELRTDKFDVRLVMRVLQFVAGKCADKDYCVEADAGMYIPARVLATVDG